MSDKTEHGSPIDVSRYLKGIDLPAGKDDLVEHARENEAPDDLIERIEAMPDEQYETMADVMKGFKASE